MLRLRRYMYMRIWRLAWPVILEMSGVMLAGILITAMVGKLGAVSLAAVGLATMVQISATMIFAAAGTGAAAIVAREIGAGNSEMVRVITGQSILLGLAFGGGLAVCGYFASPLIFVLIGGDPAVSALAARLLALMFISTPFCLIMAIGNAILRAMGKTRPAFVITTAANGIYLSVSFMLIYGWGLPAIGLDGVAWGVVVFQLFGGLAVLGVLACLPDVRLRFRDIFVLHFGVMKRILNISIPAAIEQLAMQGGRIAFTFLLAGTGAVQFAAHQIALQVESISFLPGFAFSVASMTLVGQHLGKGVPHRAEQYVWLTLRLTVGGMAVIGTVFFLFAGPLTGLFIADPAVREWGRLCVMIAALEQPTIALTYVFAGALRGSGDTKWPMYITTAGIWLLRLPLIYALITVGKMDITVAWFITAGDFLFRSFILWQRFLANNWKKR